MKTLIEWHWIYIAIYFVVAFGVFFFLKGVKDGWRQGEVNLRNKGDKEGGNKMSTKWHFVSALMDGWILVTMLFAVLGLHYGIIGLFAICISVRWWAVDGGFNWSLGLPFTYQGTTSAIDKASSKKGFKVILFKTMLLLISILLVWLTFTKI